MNNNNEIDFVSEIDAFEEENEAHFEDIKIVKRDQKKDSDLVIFENDVRFWNDKKNSTTAAFNKLSFGFNTIKHLSSGKRLANNLNLRNEDINPPMKTFVYSTFECNRLIADVLRSGIIYKKLSDEVLLIEEEINPALGLNKSTNKKQISKNMQDELPLCLSEFGVNNKISNLLTKPTEFTNEIKNNTNKEELFTFFTNNYNPKYPNSEFLNIRIEELHYYKKYYENNKQNILLSAKTEKGSIFLQKLICNCDYNLILEIYKAFLPQVNNLITNIYSHYCLLKLLNYLQPEEKQALLSEVSILMINDRLT